MQRIYEENEWGKVSKRIITIPLSIFQGSQTWCTMGVVNVIYPYSILNSAPNFHSYFTLWCFQCFQCLPIPYSDVSNVSWCFLMFSILWCFPQSSDIFLHSDVFPTLMFLKSFCSIPFQVHALMFSNVFPIFIDVAPFHSYYGFIIIMEPFW